jgi:uncharacterized protein YkwD
MTLRVPVPVTTAAVATLVTLAVALLAAVGPTTGADARTPAAHRASARATVRYQAGIFSASNTARHRHERSTFHHQTCVQRYAVRQARRMASQERMFHQDLRRVLRDCHLRKAGENVAYGYPNGRSVVDDGWMRSPEHRRNLLDAGFRLLGSGARLGADGVWYAVQVFGRHL